MIIISAGTHQRRRPSRTDLQHDEAAKAVEGLEALPPPPVGSMAMREMLTAARAAQAIGAGNGAQAVSLLSS